MKITANPTPEQLKWLVLAILVVIGLSIEDLQRLVIS